jgi:hypothetical protein
MARLLVHPPVPLTLQLARLSAAPRGRRMRRNLQVGQGARGQEIVVGRQRGAVAATPGRGRRVKSGNH